ncbi:MAG: acetate kinase, partial [bacterium]|nr:acetate kinase [bacterium]
MKILVLNCGSTSLKYKIIEMPSENELMCKEIENIDQEIIKNVIYDELKNLDIKPDIAAHRVVHGGEYFSKAVKVDDEVKKIIKKLAPLAPLHNPYNLIGIEAVEKILKIENYACFDTAFHQTLPEYAYLYGLPYELYEKHRIRKYGFHGISHKYVAYKACEILKENIKDFKIISIHIGGGASICAIKNGKSIETSMGFTPLEGLMMGTRAGSFDPEIVIYLLKLGYTLEEVETFMNKKGGLKGISGKTFDVRTLRDEELKQDHLSELALDMFVYRIKRFIGSYTAVLCGLDILIFTGGIGENAYYLRKRICDGLEYLGLKLDYEKNRENQTIISKKGSDVYVMVIPTNEELQI